MNNQTTVIVALANGTQRVCQMNNAKWADVVRAFEDVVMLGKPMLGAFVVMGTEMHKYSAAEVAAFAASDVNTWRRYD